MNRRHFLNLTASLTAASLTPPASWATEPEAKAEGDELFSISLAQWSLHRTIGAGKLDNLDFPEFSKKQFGIDAVEYVNSFFKSSQKSYLTQLKKRCDDHGVTSVLIMCDGLGHLGAKSQTDRTKTVENHKPWVEAAKALGCHTIRVNGHGAGTPDEAAKTVADGLTQLSSFAKDLDINVVVENHGGNSSNPEWLVKVIKSVNLPNCGTLPDFGNFYQFDRYDAIESFMPFAKAVSAKSREFNEQGQEVQTDYSRAMKLVVDSGYHGHVGIEYEGSKHSEDEGIRLTKALLETVRTQLAAK